jgi:hypothetical protein
MTKKKPKLSWTQPVCERCWIEREAVWDETDTEVLVGLRLPVRTMEPELERCSFCGLPTFIGVFVRADPTKVPYPAEKSDAD